MQTHRKGVTAAPKVITMANYGKELLISYLTQPNETLRDISDDPVSISEILDEIDALHRVFLELLLDAQGLNFVADDPDENRPCDDYETESIPDWEIDDDPW